MTPSIFCIAAHSYSFITLYKQLDKRVFFLMKKSRPSTVSHSFLKKHFIEQMFLKMNTDYEVLHFTWTQL